MKRARTDDGFTLIELLVVMVIIGILAAIAIPTYLNQRRMAYDAAAKSDIRGLAQLEEMHLADRTFYGQISQLVANGEEVHATSDVTLTVVKYDGINGYCLKAKHAQSANSWFYDSSAGGLQPRGTAGCPVVTGGVAGDSLTG